MNNADCRAALDKGEAIILAVVKNGVEGQKKGHTYWAFTPIRSFPLAFGMPLKAYHLEEMDNFIWRHRDLGPEYLCWEEPLRDRERDSVGHKISLVSKKPGNVLREQPYSMRMDGTELALNYSQRKALFEGHGTCSEVVSGHLLNGDCTMIVLPCAANDHMVKILEQNDVRIALRNLKATVTPAVVLQK